MNIGSASLENTQNFQETAYLINQLIFTTFDDPVLVYDHNLTVIKVNKAYITNFGFDPSGLSFDILSAKFKNHFINPYFDREAALDALSGTITRKVVFSTGNYQGKYDAGFYPLKQNHNVSMAITIWRKIEPENLGHERTFKKYDKKFIDLSPIAIFINRNGYVEYANIGALELFGATHLNEIAGKPVFEIFHPDFHDLIRSRIADLLKDKQVREVEEKIIRLDGTIRYVEVMAGKISDKPDEIIQVYLKDITSRKKTEIFNAALSSIENVIHSTVNTFEITEKAMKMATEATGCDSSAVSVLKGDFWEIVHIHNLPDNVQGLTIPLLDDPHAWLALTQKEVLLIDDAYTDSRVNTSRMKEWGIKSVVVMPLFTNRTDIGVIFFNFYNRKVFSPEKVIFLTRLSTALSLALENSELFGKLQNELLLKKENEDKLQQQNFALLNLSKELKELNATKDKFFNIIAHDLKNPFTGLIGGAELLTTSLDDKETLLKLGKMIHDSARKGFSLLENLLEWSRSQTGTITFEPVPLNLFKLVSNSTESLRALYEAKNQVIENNIVEQLELNADANMISTVIRNLVQNAIKFSHNGSKILLSSTRSDTETVISVQDTGTGMPENYLAKLFRIDEKVSSPGTNKETGTGLGLLLCKEFIEIHGGRIWAESKVGQGSTFFVSLPHNL